MQADSKFINTLMLDFSASQTEWRAQPSRLMKAARAATPVVPAPGGPRQLYKLCSLRTKAHLPNSVSPNHGPRAA